MIRFIGASLQLQPIVTAHNQWLSNTRSISYWTISVFSSMWLMPVTSSASVVHWLALHSWLLNFSRMNHDSRMTAPLWLNYSSLCSSLYRVPVTTENVCCHRNVLTEQLAGNGLVCCGGNMCLASHWLVADFHSGSAVLAFRCHVTVWYD
jgi:hypothetical protein